MVKAVKIKYAEMKQFLNKKYQNLPMWGKYVAVLTLVSVFLLLLWLENVKISYLAVLSVLGLACVYVKKKEQAKTYEEEPKEISFWERISELSESEKTEDRIAAFIAFVFGFAIFTFLLIYITLMPLLFLVDYLMKRSF